MPISRRLLLLLPSPVLAQMLGSCAVGGGAPKSWMELSLPGKSLILDSDTEVKELRFLGEATGGWVAATVGTRGGPLTAPLLAWRLEGNLLIVGDSGEFERLELLRVEGERVVTQRSSGTVVVFLNIKT